MIKSILLAVDGSTYTDAQVKHCIPLAKAFEAKVKVLSVVDIRIFEWAAVMGTDGFVPVVPTNVYREESKKILDAKAQAVLEKCSDILQKEKIEFDVEKIEGPPVDIINELSNLVDILVMGARGEFAKWKPNLVGATLDAVARQCNKSIFITPQKYQRVSSVLFAYDGSPRANKALQLAGSVATKLSVPIVIVCVHQNKPMRTKILEEASSYLEAYEVETTTVGVEGNPEKEILNQAEANESNLIVMGAFGHSRIREAILGSTTEHVVRNATIPVLLSK